MIVFDEKKSLYSQISIRLPKNGGLKFLISTNENLYILFDIFGSNSKSSGFTESGEPSKEIIKIRIDGISYPESNLVFHDQKICWFSKSDVCSTNGLFYQYDVPENTIVKNYVESDDIFTE